MSCRGPFGETFKKGTFTTRRLNGRLQTRWQVRSECEISSPCAPVSRSQGRCATSSQATEGLKGTAWDICPDEYYIFGLRSTAKLLNRMHFGKQPFGGALRISGCSVTVVPIPSPLAVKETRVMSLRDGKRGGIPPCWLQHRLTRLSAEATDGRGLGLLGNW